MHGIVVRIETVCYVGDAQCTGRHLEESTDPSPYAKDCPDFFVGAEALQLNCTAFSSCVSFLAYVLSDYL